MNHPHKVQVVAFALAIACIATTLSATAQIHQWPFEWTVSSEKTYLDPFNDVEVDVIFENGTKSWRVPMFWRGGHKWSVRFAPPSPGTYSYYLDSNDRSNPDLNGRPGTISVGPYAGKNPLLKRGQLTISANKRYFEHADGTPFYWLGDTLWSGLSDRLSWAQFKEITLDRKKKGFTVVQLVAGLVPPEEQCPADPGCRNEGGAVWDATFSRINPKYFDYADRRIQHLIDSGIVPAIVGAWYNAMDQIGEEKLRKHWRYIVARYSAYPTFWVLGGEVLDRPGEDGPWTNLARYLRSIDPYNHLITVHERTPDLLPLHDESLMDFHLFQPGHFGWSTIAVEVAQLNLHYARTAITKPLVVGEAGYEAIAKTHLEDFQRVAFWLAMLNGAAGFTYGAVPTFEAYTTDKPLHRIRWSLLDWKEGMNLPGSYQLGIGSKLLREYEWWRFVPRPDWIIPRGTTMLEARNDDDRNKFHANLKSEWGDWMRSGEPVPMSEWRQRNGTFRLPYAAGIPGRVRFVYMPFFDLIPPHPPTILNIEAGTVYRAYYWETSLGIKIDLGRVARPPPGATIFKADRSSWSTDDWRRHVSSASESADDAVGTPAVSLISAVREKDVVVTARVTCCSDVILVMRYRDADNYLAVTYSHERRSLYILERVAGVDIRLGETPVAQGDGSVRVSTEARGAMAIASLVNSEGTVTTQIVPVRNEDSGGVGYIYPGDAAVAFQELEIRQSPQLIRDNDLDRNMRDANGKFRGKLHAPPPSDNSALRVNLEQYARSKHILLDAYRPELLPAPGDWLLVLESVSE